MFHRSIKVSFLVIGFAVGLSFSRIESEITKTQIHSAANLIALDFNQIEMDSMINGLERNRARYQAIRELNIDNAVAPSMEFNPLPNGWKNLHSRDLGPKLKPTEEVFLPENIDDLAFYTVKQMGHLIKTRQITSVELTHFFLERLRQFNDTLKCVIRFTDDFAFEQARRADREISEGNYRGILHGIPYGAKDLLTTKGYPTSWGATPYKDQIFDFDATVIQKLEEAGAVLIAKTTLGALAMGDVWYGGKTRNPWDPARGSSGSSAGSASAVAAGCLPFAIGTETLGSIVSPSTVCGTTGLRPTYGTVSRYGAMALSWSMDKIGPIARTVEDCAIVFDAVRGKDPNDPSSVDMAFNYGHYSDEKLKIGYLKSDFESEYSFKSQDSLALIRFQQLGVNLIPIELPKMPNLNIILAAEAAAAFDELTRSNEDDLLVRQDANAWPNYFRTARFIPAVEYIQANRLRRILINKMDSLMQHIDIYVTPSWKGRSLGITNLTGHPQVVVPNGFSEGRPTSISFVGKLFGEAEVLAFAKMYQDFTEFHEQKPPGF